MNRNEILEKSDLLLKYDVDMLKIADFIEQNSVYSAEEIISELYNGSAKTA